jgi:diacylglycerol O-acyltransferase
VDQRLRQVFRLRQRLFQPPPGLGPAVWVDDPGFDVREHVRARAVPEPGDEAALLQVCAELNEGRLDRSRPLWQMWVLTGLADDRAAILIRLHHVMADGFAALAMFGPLFDPGPEPAAPGGARGALRPAPRTWDLAADTLRRGAASAWRAASLLWRPEPARDPRGASA